MTVDVKELLDKHNIEYKSIHGSSDLFYYCPFHTHSDSNMGSSRIDEDTGRYNCFACKDGGSIYKFIGLLEGITSNDAYKLVKNNFNQPETYDLENLKKRKIRIMSMKETYKKLSESVVVKILNKLVNTGDSLFNNRWLIVCSYIKAIPTENLDKKHDELLNIYSEFNKELKLL